MRDGMEALVVTAARMEELGMPNFGPEVNVTCENHGGPGMGLIQQWDASAMKWVAITDYIQSDREVIDPLIMEDSAAYAAESGIQERCN
jgi:branched-chain amino acid transport system substrate-binding protein